MFSKALDIAAGGARSGRGKFDNMMNNGQTPGEVEYCGYFKYQEDRLVFLCSIR